MPNNNGAEEKSGRELRLLLLVIAVAVAVLLVLSRFRYPSTDLAAVTPVVGPLDRLVPRAPFEELSTTISDLAPRLTSYVVSIQAERVPQKAERKTSAPAPAVEHRSFAALRVRPDLALAYLPTGMTVAAIGGESPPAQVLTTDVRREVVLLRVTSAAEVPEFAAGGSDFSGLTFVAAVEGSPAGPALLPVFIARADAVPDDRWPSPLLRIGGQTTLSAGTFLFTLQGRLIGLTVPLDGGLAIVPGAALHRVVAELTGAGGE